jgi:uncharacterized phage protein gp47/JayE
MANRTIYNFNDIYNLFQAKFGALTNLVDDLNIGSVARAFGQTVSFFVNFLQVQIDIAFKSFRVKTAEDTDLDNRVADWGITRYSAVAASGVVVFISSEAATQQFIIPAGTIVSTQEDVYGFTLDYSLDSDLTFPSGALQASGNVTCTEVGNIGNTASYTITNIKDPIAGISSITNPDLLASGADAESDALLRRRVPLAIIGNQRANEASVLNAAYSVPGITFAKVINNNPSSGEFTVYFSTASGTVDTSLRTQVKDAVDVVASFGIVANYATPTITNVDISLTINMDDDVQLTSASASVVSGVINSVYDYVTLNSETTLKISDIIVYARSVDGVTDVSSVLIDGVATNKVVADTAIIKLANQNNVHITVS